MKLNQSGSTRDLAKPILVLNQHGYMDPGYVGQALDQLQVPWRLDSRDLIDWRSIDVSELGGIVSLGSIQSPMDRDDHRYVGETQLLEQALSEELPIFAVCFGAQLLAQNLGSDCFELPEVHFGFDQVDFELDLPSGQQFFWHHYAFEPPAGAAVLARTKEYCIAFRYGSALAVQFHPDATPEILSAWMKAGSAEVMRIGGDPIAESIRSTALQPFAQEFISACIERFETDGRE